MGNCRLYQHHDAQNSDVIKTARTMVHPIVRTSGSLCLSASSIAIFLSTENTQT